jgi:hypothetical protein
MMSKQNRESGDIGELIPELTVDVDDVLSFVGVVVGGDKQFFVLKLHDSVWTS